MEAVELAEVTSAEAWVADISAGDLAVGTSAGDLVLDTSAGDSAAVTSAAAQVARLRKVTSAAGPSASGAIMSGMHGASAYPSVTMTTMAPSHAGCPIASIRGGSVMSAESSIAATPDQARQFRKSAAPPGALSPEATMTSVRFYV